MLVMLMFDVWCLMFAVLLCVVCCLMLRCGVACLSLCCCVLLRFVLFDVMCVCLCRYGVARLLMLR